MFHNSRCTNLAQSLIQIESPNEVIHRIDAFLQDIGFATQILRFGSLDNLYACSAPDAQNAIAFFGHVDIVPPGPLACWRHAPFAGQLGAAHLYGRGSVDMKGAIAAWLVALEKHKTQLLQADVAVCVGLTCDEELSSTDGMIPLLRWLESRSDLPSIQFALFGEPTSRKNIGDHIKIGCKGSLNVRVTAEGTAGHVAYFEEVVNPITSLMAYLTQIQHHPFPTSEIYGPTHLEITDIEVNNPATNMIPARATARFNIRFNDQQSAEQITEWLQQAAQAHSQVKWEFEFDYAGTPFIAQNSHILDYLVEACCAVSGDAPDLTAQGANSDMRFIHTLCPAVELGLRTQYAHQVNEKVKISDLEKLQSIYELFIQKALAFTQSST